MSNDTGENAIPQSKIRLPFNAYKLRCINAEKKNSAKGNPMLVNTWEITEHKPLVQDGQSVDVNGIKLTSFTVLTPKALFKVNELHAALGLPLLTEADLGSVNADHYKGQTLYGLCKSESEELKDEVTGEPVINPYDNQPMIQWNRSLTGFIAKK